MAFFSYFRRNWEKYEFFFIALLFLFIFFTVYFMPGNIPYHSDESIHNVPPSLIIHKNLVEDGEFPLWIPNIKGGWPSANLGNMITSPALIVLNYIVGPFAAIPLSRLLYQALFFVGFFLLARMFLKDMSSVIVSLVVLLSANMIRFSIGQTWALFGFSFVPLNIYLLFQIMRSKRYVLYSFFLSLSFAAQVLSGGVIHFYYQIFFFIMFALLVLLFQVFDMKKFPVVRFSTGNLKKYLKCFLIIFFVFFGLTAFRLLFFIDFTDYTNRGEGIPLQEVLYDDNRPSFSNLDEFFISSSSKSSSFNILGHILFVLAVFYAYKKRSMKILFLASVYIVYVLVSGGFLAEFFYNNLPFFKSQRAIVRMLSIGIIFGAITSGYGFKVVVSGLSKKFSGMDKTRVKYYAKYALILLVVALFFFVKGGISFGTDGIQPEKIKDFDLPEVIDDDSVYRIHMMEIVGLDYHEINPPLIYHDLESPYGFMAAMWDSRYFHEFLGVVLRRPELFGMFNTKYMLSSKPLNMTFLDYVGNFTNGGRDGLRVTPDYGEEGMVYKNKLNMPRAVIYENPVLIIGDSQNVKQMGYYTMLQQYFDANNSAIVFAKGMSISDFSIDELELFSGIILQQGAVESQADFPLLEDYIESGGMLMPDLTRDEQEFDIAKLETFFGKINSNMSSRFKEVEITRYYHDDPNTLEVAIPGKKGLLFISDKFPLYEGWNAVDENNEDIDFYPANGVLTGVILDGTEERIRFDYSPSSWRKGVLISSVVLVLVVLYFVGLFLYKKKILKSKFLSGLYEFS